MLSSSAFAAVFFIAGSSVAVAATETVFPQKIENSGKTGRLDSAAVYDGPPENLADLMPDLDRWEWDLSMLQERARKRGEALYLVCRYKGIKETVTLKIPFSAKTCKVSGIKKGTYAACR